MKSLFIPSLTAVSLLCAATAASSETLLLGDPEIGANGILFSYAGDLYSASPDGSTPRKLTSGIGEESHPAFSPDGQWIAFTGSYGGNLDVYIMPAAGGQPKRLTWHPGEDIVRGWSPDGTKILFSSPRDLSYQRGGHLYEIAMTGGLPTRLPLPVAIDGAWSEDGERLAYQPFPSGNSGRAGWKGYRGGTTPPIWIYDRASRDIIRIPNDGVNDNNPAYANGQVYFLSDRDGVSRIWRFDPASGALAVLTPDIAQDIGDFAVHGDQILYETDGRLHLRALASGADRALAIQLATDLPARMPRYVDGKDFIHDHGLSPDGARAVFGSRGEIVTAPTGAGAARIVTTSPGAHDRSALYMPDGERIAWLSDRSGEYQLVIGDPDGIRPLAGFALGDEQGRGWFRLLDATPDGSAILYEDSHLGLWLITLADGKSRKIGSHQRRWYPHGFEIAVSPDSRWVAYSRVGPGYLRELLLHEIATGRTLALVDDIASAAAPVFSRDGRYLYFTASTSIGPASAWLDMSNRQRPVRRGVYVAVLAAGDATPLPFEDGVTLAPPPRKGRKAKERASVDTPPATDVDAPGLQDRIIAVPMAERDYQRLMIAGDGALLALAARVPGSIEEPPGADEAATSSLYRYDLKTRKESLLLERIADLSISRDGRRLLLRRAGKTWETLDSAAAAVPVQTQPLPLDGLKIRVDPEQEWRQIFEEALRIERDFFYDPGLHGLDWQAIGARYRALLPHVGRREDLTRLLISMIAELGVGHARVFGGDAMGPEGAQKTGLLGADYEIENGQYRIARLYDGGAWNSFLGAPLAIPGLGVRTGDYILAIDGEPLRGEDNIHRHLEGKVAGQVVLKLAHDAAGKTAYEVIVQPVPDERPLRRWAWIEDNRRRVAEASDGRVGYVYLPNTAEDGFRYFNRFFFGQLDREALIIDERGNGGGQAADYIVDILTRPYLGSWKDRDGALFTTPAGAVFGPKVMLIDQFAGSGGDFLPYAFRHQGGGALVGARTWGGLVGIGVAPKLIDGGAITAPYFRFIHPDGQWAIENEGVRPDISVEMTPRETTDGRDPQLEAAIGTILEQLRDHKSPVVPAAPPYPRR